MRFPLLIICLVLSSFANGSEELDWRIHGLPALALTSFEAVDIELNDSVTGGCMARPNSVKKSAEVQLRRNNFKIGDNTTYAVPYLSISALGYRNQTKGGHELGCIVHVDVRLRVAVQGVPYAFKQKLGESSRGVFQHDFLLASSLLTDGSASSMQNRIEKVVEDAVDEFFLKSQRAKDLLAKHFPGALRLSE